MIMNPPMLEVYRMLKLKKGVQQMIDEARQEIVNHTPEEAKRRVDEENALLVDVRDIRELQRDGVIPGAFHAPRGMLEFWIDPEFQYFKEVFAEDREFILF
jgi:rhodanese-related sulfurtransferase